MNIIAILFGLGMLAVAAAFVVKPFQQKNTRNKKRSNTGARPDESRVAALSALRDLEFDHKIGKVIDEDYAPARAQLLAEAAHYIQQQEAEEEKLEALIRARRISKAAHCEQCGGPLEADQRFCSKCGTPANRSICPSCGKKIRAGDLFCSSCGSQLEACTAKSQSSSGEPGRSVRAEAVG